MPRTGEFFIALAANFIVAGAAGYFAGTKGFAVSFGIGIMLLLVGFMFRKKPEAALPLHIENKPTVSQDYHPVFSPQQNLYIGTHPAQDAEALREIARREAIIVEYLKKTPTLGYDVSELSKALDISMPDLRDILEELEKRKFVWSVPSLEAIGGKSYFIDPLHLPNPQPPEKLKPNQRIVAQPIVATERSAAEQDDYDTVKDALTMLKNPGRIALRHIRRQGTLTFGSPGGGVQPVLPPGLNFETTLWVYRHCASVGILTQKNNLGVTEQTFTVSPKMGKALDQLLYP